ncbi:MAG TPA: queuosine precursor transporter [Candidatus Paceibacterota bacterium]|jgi:uncharacterized integral membrane protein (TIGR00697 family)|nr:queuosine precursor transporter [Candidatus Paceibacterota bacterium]
MRELTERDYKKILVCLTLYITALFASNTLGIKLMPFLWGTHLSVGVFFFPIVFLMTDVIGEVYGKKMSKLFVLSGALSIMVFLFFSLIESMVPWSKEALWAKDSYNTIFGLSARISIASVAAFVIGEYQDVIAFFFFRRRIGTKRFWLRANLASLWSQLLDTVIFMSIAFAGVYSFHDLVLITIPWYIYKVTMGFFYTPLSYLGIRLLRGKNPADANQNLQNQSI